MYKTHPQFWYSVLRLKGASHTRVDTVPDCMSAVQQGSPQRLLGRQEKPGSSFRGHVRFLFKFHVLLWVFVSFPRLVQFYSGNPLDCVVRKQDTHTNTPNTCSP